MTGMVFDIQKFSIHDGPGIRTTVFMKGCPLSCRWCHNPESKRRTPQLSFIPERCIGCGFCFERCPQHAHLMTEEGHVLDRNLCRECGACTEECYAEALEMVGREMTVDEVMTEVLKDKPFYETSGGGMTLSGGEPLLQCDFTEALLLRAREEALHCCIETCGYAPYDDLERLCSLVDLFLYDVKDTNSQRHKEYTGVDNERILSNLARLHDRGAAIVVRLPLIPGLNDGDDHFDGIAELARRLPDVQGFEIMPYHSLGEGKLQRLGLDDQPRLGKIEAPTRETVAAWIADLRRRDVPVLHES